MSAREASRRPVATGGRTGVGVVAVHRSPYGHWYASVDGRLSTGVPVGVGRLRSVAALRGRLCLARNRVSRALS